VKFVISITEHNDDEFRATLIIVLIYEKQTQGLVYVQCTKNCLTCENYTASYKIFQKHQVNSRRLPVFPGTISNARKFPGLVDTP